MSMANFFNRATNEIQFQNLDATNLQINNVPFSGSGGGSDTIVSSDSSIVVTNTTGQVDITQAGKNWSSFDASSNVDFNLKNINHIGSISFDNNLMAIYYNSPSIAVSVGGGASGTLYDTEYNKPGLSDILIGNPNALGYNMTGVGNITATNLTVSNATGVINVVNTATSATGLVYSSLNPQPNGANHNILNYQLKTVPQCTFTNSSTPASVYTFTNVAIQTAKYFNLKISSIPFTTESGGVGFSNEPFILYLATTNNEIYNPRYSNCIYFKASSGSIDDVSKYGYQLYTYTTTFVGSIYLIMAYAGTNTILPIFSGMTLSGMLENSLPNIVVA